MSPLEPTLSKIPAIEKWRASRATPPRGSASLRAAQSPQKLTNLLAGGCKKFFSNKESIFAGFASLLSQGRAAPHPKPRSAQLRLAGKKFPFPFNPLPLFCPLAGNERILKLRLQSFNAAVEIGYFTDITNVKYFH